MSSCRSATTTLRARAASWRAAAAPMPDAPPVTIAEAPVMSMRRSIGHGSCASGRAPARRRAHDSEVGRAPGDDDSRPGEEDVTPLVARHGEGRPVLTRQRPGPSPAAATAAAQAPVPQERVSPDAALVDPHRHVAAARGDDELHVDARAGRAPASTDGRRGQRSGVGQVVDEADRVRVADVDLDRGATCGPRPPTGSRSRSRSGAHVDGVSSPSRVHRLHAGPGARCGSSSADQSSVDAGSGRRPGPRCRTSRRASRRRCGSP